MQFLNGGRLEYTLALIKPDAVEDERVGNIISLMEGNFFVADVLCVKWPPGIVAMFYKEHEGKPFYADLIRFMTSERLWAITLVSPYAVGKWRAMMGPTDPHTAADHTIRGRFARKDGIIMHNVVHGSDSLESAGREVRFVDEHLGGNWEGGAPFGEEAMRLIEKYKNKTWIPGKGLQPT